MNIEVFEYFVEFQRQGLTSWIDTQLNYTHTPAILSITGISIITYLIMDTDLNATIRINSNIYFNLLIKNHPFHITVDDENNIINNNNEKAREEVML